MKKNKELKYLNFDELNDIFGINIKDFVYDEGIIHFSTQNKIARVAFHVDIYRKYKFYHKQPVVVIIMPLNPRDLPHFKCRAKIKKELDDLI